MDITLAVATELWIGFQNYWLIVLGFNDMSTLVGYFCVVSQKKGEKRQKR